MAAREAGSPGQTAGKWTEGFFITRRDITERRRFQEALRLSEERYALAMEVTGDGHWDWDITKDRYYVSPRLLAICELPADTRFFTRAEFITMMPLHPEDKVKYLDGVKAHFEGGGARFDMEVRAAPHLEARWVHMTGLCLRDAAGNPIRWTGCCTDISDRREAEEELRARQEMLDLAQKAARAVAFEWRIGKGEGRNRWSPDLEAMYGLAPGNYDGSYEQWQKLVHPEDRPVVKAAIQHAMATGDVAAEYRVVHGDGSVHRLQAKGRMLFAEDGSPNRLIGFMLDVTQQRRVEDEMKRLERQLSRAQRLEALGTLAGGIAHDFNNILGAILGYGEMAQRDAQHGTRLRRDIESMIIAGERGRALVERILAFSRSGMGERVPIAVEAVVREALHLVQGTMPPDIRVETRFAAGTAAMLGDPSQVHQVLTNLAINAVQAMPNGGTLTVTVDLEDVERPRIAAIGDVKQDEYVVLTVGDTGCGIAPQVMDRIFDPFFTTKDVAVGTGLGLSLVHGIVTEVGGAIEVMSAPGEGSRFSVYLPRHGEAGASSAAAPAMVARGHGERVLVVDDEEALVDIAVRVLEGLGYSPTGYTSSARALAALRERPDAFDVLVTDERMPGMSGTELITEARALREDLAIVLVSGYLSATAIPVGGTRAADAVLCKPISERELAGSLARLLARHATPI